LASWISSRDVDASLADRLRNTLVGTLMAPVTSAITTYVTLLNIVQGDPGGFEVIAKTKTPSAVGAGK
jgi:integral membrane sensor domain MASE1